MNCLRMGLCSRRARGANLVSQRNTHSRNGFYHGQQKEQILAIVDGFSSDMRVTWQQFTAFANVGHLHPLDLERFAEFVAASHAAGHSASIDFTQLCKETPAWGPDDLGPLLEEHAIELGDQLSEMYEFDRAILPPNE